MYQIKPDKLYGHPEKDFHQLLWLKLLIRYKSITNVAKVFKLNVRQLYKWKEGKNNYPLIVLFNMSNELRIELKLEYIKTGKNSDAIINPKITFEENSQLIEFFGHLLHDGGIDSRYGVHYTTNSKIYTERFEELVNVCFGKMKVEKRIEKNKLTLYYPAVLGYLITGTFGIPKGSKVENNIGIPTFIKNSSENKKWLYIITSYLCDGTKNRVAITASSNSLSESPQLLKDIQAMLNSLDINSVTIKGSHIYQTRKGLHRGWILRILDKREKFIFKNYLGLYGDFCS